MKLLDVLGCDFVPTVHTGDKEKDNKENTELYLKLLNEGKAKGYYPILIYKDTEYFIHPQRYGFTDTPDDYSKITKRLVELAEESCFDVWMGRLIYNYYLNCDESIDDVRKDLEMLNPPDDSAYIKRFEQDIPIRDFVIDEESVYLSSEDDEVFALMPISRPWEALAWIPMGGFNWCPDELHQIALAKELYEQFGAIVMGISHTTVDYYLPDPLVDRENIEKATKILIAADNDTYEDYDVAADLIAGNHRWHLWWD